MEATLIGELIKNGAAFVLAAVMLWLYVRKVQDYKELVASRFKDSEAAVAQVIAVIKVTAASEAQHRATIEEANKALQGIDRRLEDLTVAVRRLDREDLTGPIEGVR